MVTLVLSVAVMANAAGEPSTTYNVMLWAGRVSLSVDAAIAASGKRAMTLLLVNCQTWALAYAAIFVKDRFRGAFADNCLLMAMMVMAPSLTRRAA